MLQLQSHTQYLHAGEYLSKLLFLHETSKTHACLLIAPKDALAKYLKVAQDRKIPLVKVESLEDIQRIEPETLGCIENTYFTGNIEKKAVQEGFSISSGEHIFQTSLAEKLQKIGYDFHEYEKEKSYKIMGDVLSVYLKKNTTLLISFWGNEIESIRLNGKIIPQYHFASAKEFEILTPTIHTIPLWKQIQDKNIFCIFDGCEFQKEISDILAFLTEKASFDMLENTIDWKFQKDLAVTRPNIETIEDLKEILSEKNIQKHISTRHADKISEFLEMNHLGHIRLQHIQSLFCESFIFNNFVHIGDDIIGKIFIKKRHPKKLSAQIDLMLKIQNGDYVVHIDHGIGKFVGIVTKDLAKIQREYMEIEYLDDDRLFVPLSEITRVSKYVGSENPKLTALSGKIWEKKMLKADRDIQILAESILENFAQRKIRLSSENILPLEKIHAFQAAFPYEYTQDQKAAIDAIFDDMQSQKNMDRLVVGDVGFGKTEIAFNAAFLALCNQKQVLFISPLVVLAHEHYAKALERFAGFGFTIKILTRLQSEKEARNALVGLANGSVHMVIGTHRLLSEKIQTKNLGLMIVDEEHKFGVEDKEKIKSMRVNIDILSLSATPIPRSLNLALAGIRDMSLLKTPPKGRKSIQTSVVRYNPAIIQSAGEREFKRGGQLFFVHNRVTNIDIIAKQISELFPKKKIVITHGRLPGDELEDRIIAFKQKKYDILVSTTVIENGIDFSNVNTIFINECQSFGISQIHQLRGRVGRSQSQGYCYLLYQKDTIDSDAAKRLQTIVDYSYLGAGFELAMKDLELRGGGDILGIRQSGQAQEIGMSLFLKMLEEKIESIKESGKNEKQNESLKKSVQIDIPLSMGIPDEFFTGEGDKLNFYREIESLETHEDIQILADQLQGENPELFSKSKRNIQNLFLLLHLQVEGKKYALESIKKVGIHYQIDFLKSAGLENLKKFLTQDTELLFFVVDGHKVRTRTKDFENDEKFIEYLLHILESKNPKRKIQLKKNAIS